MRLLQSHQYSHISISCMRSGPQMANFRIAILATKKHMSLEGIVQCCTGIRSSNGYLLIGRIFEPTMKPCLLVFNRGSTQ